MELRSFGDRSRWVELGGGLLRRGTPAWSDDALRDVGFAALSLAAEPCCATPSRRANALNARSLESAPWVAAARHRLQLLEGQTSEVDAVLRDANTRWSQNLRLIAVDALEGLAVAAARAESWAECLRLLAAAQRLRE
jgi:hypothetical protein